MLTTDSYLQYKSSYFEDCLDHEFPIHSQTSNSDKVVLLKLREIARMTSSYSYLEVGSFLGGSLTPFVGDPCCIRVLSIDQRGRRQSDERGRTYDYTSTSSEN